MRESSERCYARPLLALNQNPNIIFQLGKNNRIINPPIYFEKCSTKSNLNFEIDDNIYQFMDYSLSKNVSIDRNMEGVTVLGPNVERYFDVNRTFHEVKHITLYNEGEISTSLIDNEEVLDYINQEIYLLAKFGSPKYEEKKTVDNYSPVVAFFSEIMKNIIFFLQVP